MSSNATAGKSAAATITEHEARRWSARTRRGRTPVVFVHGLWLLPSSWDRWATVFEEAGYTALTPGWPDDPETVEEANAHPEVFAHKTVGQVADHFAEVIRAARQEARDHRPLLRRPARADPRRPRTCRGDGRDRPGAVPRRAAAAALGAEVGVAGARQPRQPQSRRAAHLRAVPLRVRQRRQRDEAKELYETYAVPASGAPLFQAATANLNPWTEAKVDTKNPDRGPLLIVSGEKDHTVPWAIANASYKQQKKNDGVTEIVEIPNRGHALTIDSGWREVAAIALDFVKRFA